MLWEGSACQRGSVRLGRAGRALGSERLLSGYPRRCFVSKPRLDGSPSVVNSAMGTRRIKPIVGEAF
jgi:hypothetical protein